MTNGAGGSAATTDVLIAGAGPTGLLAAALLRRLGVSVRIFDKAPGAVKESRAFGIQARSMELFEKMGLAGAMLDRGLLATGVEVYVDGERAAAIHFDDIGRTDSPYQFLLMVPQSEIEAVLVDDLNKLGLEVDRGVALVGLDQDQEGVTARLVGGAGATRELRAAYLIGADGAHSVVRKALGLSFEGAAYPVTFLLADCRVEWPLGYDHFKLMTHGRAFGLYLPLKGHEISRIMALEPGSGAPADPSNASQGSSPVTLPEVEAAFRQACGIEVSLSDAVWMTRYRIHHRGVDRYRVGRAFVAGDAAHIHSPAGGQGMNTGLQDAANLAWKLALVLKGAAGPALLDSYHDERWPVGQRVLDRTDRLFSFMTSQSGWGAGLRRIVLPVVAATVTRFGMVRSRAFHFISQLGIRYEPGAFVDEAISAEAGTAFREGPGAGQRAPNALVDRHRDVFDLISGYGFDLLALSRRPLSEEEIGRLADELESLARDAFPGGAPGLRAHLIGHSLIGRDARLIQTESSQVFAAYGLDADTCEALYLIRPDGYVAWRSDRLDIEACRRFISQRFAQTA